MKRDSTYYSQAEISALEESGGSEDEIARLRTELGRLKDEVAAKEKLVENLQNELKAVEEGDSKSQVQFLVNKCNKLEGKLAIAKEQIRMYEEDVLKDKEKVNTDFNYFQ